MYLLNVYSIFKVREVFALTNQLGTFFDLNETNLDFFKNFFDRLSGAKKPFEKRISPLSKGKLANWNFLYNVQDITVIMS